MPRTSDLFIDTVTFTIHVPEELRRHVRELMWERQMDEVPEQAGDFVRADRPREQFGSPKGGFSEYHEKFRVPLTPHHFATIGLAPRPDRRYMRIEYSPRKAGEHGCERLEVILRQALGDDLEPLLAQSNLTRIDFAVDIFMMNLDRFLFEYVDGVPRKTMHFYGNNHAHETQQFGLRLQTNVKVYNKGRERADNRQADHRYQHRRTRIECSLKNTFGIGLSHLARNPFAPLVIREVIRAEDDERDYLWRFFIEACRARGAENALSWIPDHAVRSSLCRRLADRSHLAWWNPQALWLQLPERLSSARVLSPSLARVVPHFMGAILNDA